MVRKGLKLVMAGLVLVCGAAPALADACSTAVDEAMTVDGTILTKSVQSVATLLYTDEPAARQKAVCEHERALLGLIEDSLRRHRAADRVCGNKIRWVNCDTACAASRVQAQERKVAHECNPARIPEAIEKARLEKAERDRAMKKETEEMNARVNRQMPFIEACMNLGASSMKTAAETQWAGWIRDCNKAEKDICAGTWLSLEEKQVPTTGLTCRPTADQRAERKKTDAFVNSPEQKQMNACFMIGAPGMTKAERDENVRLCNQSTDCSMIKPQVEAQAKQRFPELTCPKG
jgi:hypothetical protein